MELKTYFGEFGGRYAPEMIVGVLDELARTYDKLAASGDFKRTLKIHQQRFAGRPTPITFAENLTDHLGAYIFLKNEGQNMTGAHKMNHCIGQALVAREMGKTRLIAETGAGQHGLATATVAAKFGMECTIYMGAVDIERQRPNVFFMEQLGAKVVPVHHGSKTLKEAVTAAFKDWVVSSDTTHYVIGSALGPDPYPRMNRDFQSVIGQEVQDYFHQLSPTSKPHYLFACVGGGSNAMGLFYPFLDEDVKLVGVEAGGMEPELGQHATRIGNARVGVNEGYKSLFLQTEGGNIANTHSIAAGLDYPGIGPELANLAETGRVTFISATDQETLAAWQLLAQKEGIIAALESAHAVAGLVKMKEQIADRVVVVNISGRGEKDIFTLARNLGDTSFKGFLEQELERWNNV